MEVVQDRQRFYEIQFDEWSAQIRPEAFAQLDELGRALESNELKQVRIVIEGHTDDRGPYEKNMDLSWARADSVKQYLVSRFNVSRDAVVIQGYGPDRPRVPNDSDWHYQMNRRVEVVFLQ